MIIKNWNNRIGTAVMNANLVFYLKPHLYI